MIVLNVLSAFGGGMYVSVYLNKFYSNLFKDGVRGGFANAFSTASKYEINPEEIKVNFSDVRGVRN
jgi:fluoride ion exporter CrcB/FEX